MKRIFMVSSYPLFSQGVETLLRQSTDIEFVGRETDSDQAIECIKLLQPDIVIVDHEFPLCTQSPMLLRILDAGLSAKVIGLNLRNNTMCIYRGEQRVAQTVQDLIHAIENDAGVTEADSVAEVSVQEHADEQVSERRITSSNEISDEMNEKTGGTQSV